MSAPPEVRRAADGTLYVRPDMGRDPVTGRRVRPYHRLAATTMADAEAEARAWWAEQTENPPLSVALARYVALRAAVDGAAGTARTYRTCARAVEPFVGRVRVRDLTTRDVGELYRALLERGGARGQGLSRSTVLRIHWFLRGFYRQQVADGTCATNPVADAPRPRPESPEAMALDEADLRRLDGLLSAEMAGEDVPPRRRMVAMAAWLALRTGMRCGEACALLRQDVRPSQCCLRVRATVVETGHGLMRQPRTKGGRAVLSFGLATGERTRNSQTGEWEDRTSFVDCTVWGERGKSLQQRLSKGAKVAVRGALRSHSWEDRASGKRRTKLEVVVHDLEFMQRQEGSPAPSAQPPVAGTPPVPPTPQQASQDFYDEDIPF